MIDGWHGYRDCPACGAKPNTPCVSLYSHNDLQAGITLLATPHGGRPHVADLAPGDYFRLTGQHLELPPIDAAPIDRCPDCSAVIPQPEPLEGGGTISRPVEHLSTCPRHRPDIVVHSANVSSTPARQPYTPTQLQEARAQLQQRRTPQNASWWMAWALGYVTAGADRHPLQPHQLAMAAALAEIDDWSTLA